MLINLEPGENSSLKGLKEGNIPLSLFLESTIEHLTFSY